MLTASRTTNNPSMVGFALRSTGNPVPKQKADAAIAGIVVGVLALAALAAGALYMFIKWQKAKHKSIPAQKLEFEDEVVNTPTTLRVLGESSSLNTQEWIQFDPRQDLTTPPPPSPGPVPPTPLQHTYH